MVRLQKSALKLLPACLDNVLQQPEGKRRYCDTVLSITKAFALCGTMEEAMKYSAEVAFHQAIRAPLIKSGSIGKSGKYKNVDYELKQLVSESLVSGGVADVFKIAGLESPDISILSDEFLAEVKKMPQKNLAVELLQKLMKDEMKTRFKAEALQEYCKNKENIFWWIVIKNWNNFYLKLYKTYNYVNDNLAGWEKL